ncbi:MAG: hypothetical protein VX113_04705, partial [Pseudomonadota bacterium]|nr:hypothetical protein [Pseudomonadota bacterium]
MTELDLTLEDPAATARLGSGAGMAPSGDRGRWPPSVADCPPLIEWTPVPGGAAAAAAERAANAVAALAACATQRATHRASSPHAAPRRGRV